MIHAMTMSADGFHALEFAHLLPGRVRFRYRAPRSALPALILAVAALPGVQVQRFNPNAHSLTIRFDASRVTSAQLRRQILALRVKKENDAPAPIVEKTPAAPAHPGRGLAVLLAGLLLPSAVALPLAALGALPLLREGAQDFSQTGITSHTLEALAVSISLMRGDTLSANATVCLLELGEQLEASIARQSDDLLKRLLNPVGERVWVVRDGQEMAIAADAVRIGDTVAVGAGAVIPVDGTVLSGEALANEAAMTGESAPVEKRRGARVTSGTHLEEGRLRIYAERVGAQTAVARIAEYVERSLAAKSATQLSAARLADRLVPTILGLAGASYLVSGNARHAAAVLQADYACALKLATPVAFKAAMYQAGKNGILVKGADALERLAEADTFVFDKTGTLTFGNLIVTDSIAFDNAYSAEDLICLAASVEEHYFHPLALAVVEAARAAGGQHFHHREVEFVVAHGVASEIEGKRIVVGSRHFIEDDEGIDISTHHAALAPLIREGKTLLYIGFGGRLLGVLALKDSLRGNAAETIARLRALGARQIVMLTGDHRERAADYGRLLRLDAVHAELMPEEKAAIIQRLKEEGAKIAFVGDGINDAPALAGAHVGIAMQRGADVARLTADVALLEDDIARVADARALALATLARVSGNYRLTIGLNTAILAAAALGALPPIAASVLHNGSTLAILSNALRRYRINYTRTSQKNGFSPARTGE
ncbi:MAG: heavy metal translocating P-type ATPase [Zoogloeaceae bacterium]|jgi:heavy metal translocating P-type ATPase|nr:heavy metal translocating P-type ATPase [Zoogloeaceae bacterium]